jgi:hypothetical protein
VPRLCELYLGICLTTEGKGQKTLSVYLKKKAVASETSYVYIAWYMCFRDDGKFSFTYSDMLQVQRLLEL